MADPHVLVHDALASLLRQEIPVGRLRERVDDQVLRAFGAEQRLLLLGRLPDVLGWTDPPDQRLADGQPAPEPGAKQRGPGRFEGLDARSRPPQEHVHAGLQPNRGVADRAPASSVVLHVCRAEVAAVSVPVGVGAAAPLRFEGEAERLNVDLVGHGASRIQVARSPAA
jgi:hypothetical protein